MFVSSISDLSVSFGIVLIPVLLDLLTIFVPYILSELILLISLNRQYGQPCTLDGTLVPQRQAETCTMLLVTTNNN